MLPVPLGLTPFRAMPPKPCEPTPVPLATAVKQCTLLLPATVYELSRLPVLDASISYTTCELAM